MKETIDEARWTLKVLAYDGARHIELCAKLDRLLQKIESAHDADQETIARLMKLTDDEREAGRDRLLAAVRDHRLADPQTFHHIVPPGHSEKRGDSYVRVNDDNPACDRCNGTGAEPLSDNVNYIPCRKCGAKRR